MPLPDGFSLRPATLDDVDLWCRLKTADPRLAFDPVLERAHWDQAPPGVVRERKMIQEGGIAIGRLSLWRPPAADGDKQFVDVTVDFLEGHAEAELLEGAWDLAEQRARDLDADVITTQCLDHEMDRRDYIGRRGYLLDRAGIISGLDIGRERERFLEMARETEYELALAGVELTTLASLGEPARRPVYEVFVESESDIPTTVPISHDSFEQFVAEVTRPWAGEHRVWVAVEGGRPVGLSWLAYHPTTGNVFTEMTGVARAARGRGVARGLKLKTIEQALAAGVTTLLTQNDEANAPILKINRAFGYRPLREVLLHRKPA